MGGRFNPIVMADRPEEAHQLIELYRADVIVAIGSEPTVVEPRLGLPGSQHP